MRQGWHAREARSAPARERAVMSTAARSAEAPGSQAARTRSMSRASQAVCARPAARPARCRAAESPALQALLSAGLQSSALEARASGCKYQIKTKNNW